MGTSPTATTRLPPKAPRIPASILPRPKPTRARPDERIHGPRDRRLVPQPPGGFLVLLLGRVRGAGALLRHEGDPHALHDRRVRLQQGQRRHLDVVLHRRLLLASLIGGFVADRFFGKYWTIVGFSVPYIVGQLMIGIDNPVFLYVSLALLAMGSGVIKPNISTLMGNTYDLYRPGQTRLRSEAFAMFYFSINVGEFLSQVLMPTLRTQMGYQVAFMFPAALMVLAFAVFASGKRLYAPDVPTHEKKSPEERAYSGS